jgi:2-dehydro-3-deoxyphosphogluconate aldolase / (4S)-4-hydroxy-2-oxoglutarate aldolase
MTFTFEEAFANQRVMAILRGYSPEETVALCRRAWSAGIDVVEVPIQTVEALPALRAAIREGTRRGKPVGAGTVTTQQRLEAALEAGAAFTVAPGTDPAMIRSSAAHEVPHLPGVATATDLQIVIGHGLVWAKAFPARELTPGWFSAIAGPFPEVRLVATGGVDAGNAQRFLDAGARVVAVGSALTSADQLERLASLAGTDQAAAR